MVILQKENNVKKIILFFISFISITFLSSCTTPSMISLKTNDPTSIDFDTDSFAQETMLEVLRCFDEEDTETLKSLFSEELSTTSNIDKQIEEAMDYYEGKSVSHDEVYKEEGSAAFQDHHYTYRSVWFGMNEIVTDKNKTYRIEVRYIVVNDDDSRIGLYKIFFKDDRGVSVLVIDPDGGKNITKGDTENE